MSGATDRIFRLLRTASIASFFALTSGVSYAQDGPLQLRGYIKNLGLASSSVLEDRLRFLDITRLRLRGIAALSPHVRSEVWLDTEVLAGSFVGTAEFDIGRELERREWVDLDWQLASASNFVMKQRVFRAYVSAYTGSITATVGRQRVAWGTSFTWNPTDLLNPFNPAAIELGEKTGMDGVHISVATGDFSRIEIAYAQGDRKSESSVAARSSTKLGEYDVSFMGGYFRDDWVVGGDFAGYVGDAGLRGEIAYTVTDARSDYLR
ncbi:MAG: hypothetical protein R3282_03850, partial [Rhodothermales bacterium]|nr:hypothetical protein [Rhodothermales bacterium]